MSRSAWHGVCGAGLLLVGLAGLWPPSAAESPPAGVGETYQPPRGYVCYRAAAPLVIDGKLDEPAWQAAAWSEDFVDIEGSAKPRPRFRTRVKMLWDDQYFYVGAELEETHVWGTLKAHDSIIFQDNDFEVFIDPNGDNHEYYEFEMNALNTGWDLLLPRPYKDGGQAINSWEIPGLKTAVQIDGTLNQPGDVDRGWTVEIAFPWKVLGELAYQPVPPREGAQWRVNFSRVEWQHRVANGKYERVPDTREDNWVWSPQGVIDMHRPETWGYVQFTSSRPGMVAFQPDPAGPARHLLHRIYYAQRDYREKHRTWATRLDQLGLQGVSHPSLLGPPTLETTRNSYEASCRLRSPSGELQQWHIRQDAKISVE